MATKPNILVAPLDWGLGHATRCIPLIEALLMQDCTVMLAADGPQAKVLQEAFPKLPMLLLPGYGVQYSRKNVLLKILSQVPAIIKAISKEHVWLQQIVRDYKIDVVISDNRYGLWSSHCKSILITHQLTPALPNGLQWASTMLRKMMYQQIERFHECWVPDIENSNGSLSGSLGHPSKMPKVPVHYIGWLTRFTLGKASAVESAYKLLIILSGPEPQRTMLEQMLLEQLTSITATVLMVRGLPGETNIPSTPAHIKVVNHLPAAALQTAMQQSEFVLARGGYSTLMDAFTLQKKCVFVPTPGQTEQVYLCNMLHQKKAALCFAQPSFQLSAALKLAADFSFQMPTAPNPDLLSDFVRNWLLRL